MTKLKTVVKRETDAVYRGRNIIIQIEPPYLVRIKEKGRRTWYETTIQSIFAMAAKQYAERTRKERKQRKEARNG